MKIAIVGSRNFNDYDMFCEHLYSILFYNMMSSVDDITQIISGGARGADSLAERFAEENDIEIKVYPAEWDKYGKKAGYLRNELIVQAADVVIAFWNGVSRGTKHSIDLAKKYDKECIVVDV